MVQQGVRYKDAIKIKTIVKELQEGLYVCSKLKSDVLWPMAGDVCIDVLRTMIIVSVLD